MRLSTVWGSATAVMIAVGGLMLAAPSALAANTTINTSGGDGAGTSLLDVLKGIYGSTSGAIGDATITFANATLTRVQDSGGSGDLNLHTGEGFANGGTTNDQVWKDGISTFVVEAKYAGNSQTFGFDTNGAAAGGETTLFAAASAGNTATAGPVSGSTFQWFLKTSGLNSATYYSDNGGAFDHMVTWEVTYTAGPKTGQRVWIVAWEDQTPGDTDYQDLVVEITVVPLPAAAWSGLGMLAGLGAFAFMRRRRHARFVS